MDSSESEHSFEFGQIKTVKKEENITYDIQKRIS